MEGETLDNIRKDSVDAVPTTEDSTTKDLTTNDPATEDFATEDPATEDPITNEDPAKESEEGIENKDETPNNNSEEPNDTEDIEGNDNAIESENKEVNFEEASLRSLDGSAAGEENENTEDQGEEEGKEEEVEPTFQLYCRFECLHVVCECDEPPVVKNFEYKMDHPKRGVAVIFNNGTFHSSLDLPDRPGYEDDGAVLKEAFSHLGFDARHYLDLTVQNMICVLQLLIMEGHEDADCLVLVFMTHGQRQPGTTHDVIFGKDGPFWVDNIVAKFNGDGCPSLAGKPKLFFVQASRGTQADPGVKVVADTETDARRRRKTIPQEADVLVSQSTVSGFTDLPGETSGSIYIRSLADTLLDHGRTRDIHWLLTRVHSLVANEFESSSADKNKDKKGQMPTYRSTLTKVLTFPPKAEEEEVADKSEFW